jgi:DNA-binding CsgD family transcriptional regulator
LKAKESMAELRLGLLVTNVSHNRWYAALSSTSKTIGRSKTMEIRVPSGHPSVSRAHARVWSDHRGGWICDLASTFGTAVNGVRLAPERETRIVHGDRVLLGTLELIVVDEQELLANVLIDDPGSSDSAADTLKLGTRVDAAHAPQADALSALSHAEREVLMWVSRGFTTPEEIGKKLSRSPHTVRTQLASIFSKLGVHSRDELVGYLLRLRRSEDNGGGSVTI